MLYGFADQHKSFLATRESLDFFGSNYPPHKCFGSHGYLNNHILTFQNPISDLCSIDRAHEQESFLFRNEDYASPAAPGLDEIGTATLSSVKTTFRKHLDRQKTFLSSGVSIWTKTNFEPKLSVDF
jgi:hypothetical protein